MYAENDFGWQKSWTLRASNIRFVFVRFAHNFFSALKNSPALQRVGYLTLRGEFFEEKKFTKLQLLGEHFYVESSYESKTLCKHLVKMCDFRDLEKYW